MQRCTKGFNSGVKGLTVVHRGKVKSVWQMDPKSWNISRVTDSFLPIFETAPFFNMLHPCYDIAIHLRQLSMGSD
jgi:hypothetical protein